MQLTSPLSSLKFDWPLLGQIPLLEISSLLLLGFLLKKQHLPNYVIRECLNI